MMLLCVLGMLLGGACPVCGQSVNGTAKPDPSSRTAPEASPKIPATLPEAVAWLKARSTQMIRDCRRQTKSGITAFPPQVGGGYEAFWLRDYAYMLEGNLAAFSDQELEQAYRFFLAGQRSVGGIRIVTRNTNAVDAA